MSELSGPFEVARRPVPRLISEPQTGLYRQLSRTALAAVDAAGVSS
ncbi:hypothetical protein RESH_02902 [Rhodopirellula europaea SH398]|uniref:Uncharacterized protein n=1 Tax=Rhodopirellula europaea SH398 TaxID=1263868 RepID=M5SFN9_9BACT|nr:hypothetical protein RESH_02902 [Rhodopirellula europaea SH398]